MWIISSYPVQTINLFSIFWIAISSYIYIIAAYIIPHNIIKKGYLNIFYILFRNKNIIYLLAIK